MDLEYQDISTFHWRLHLQHLQNKMTTQTQTLRRRGVDNASRTHDYLYDPLYVLASDRDHARATFKAHTGPHRVKQIPNHKTMFSELRHHPRFGIKLDTTDPVPNFINRQWRGYADQQREALIRYATTTYDPSVEIPAQTFTNAEVSGKNRHMYFRRPHIPFLGQVPPEVLLASARQDPLLSHDHMQMERPPTPFAKTVETQTDYRDSEAQTDPYTPEYVVRPGEAPELLTLATLSFGRGLPAGIAEVEMIERARAKRIWEASLPPLSDMSQLDKRRRMMDDMETQEWALREQEIEKLQEARLEVLKKLLAQREENHQDLNIKRLDKLWTKKQKTKARQIMKIRNEHIKRIRKLTGMRQNIEGVFHRRDILGEYADYASQSYAPKTRIGLFIDRGSEQYVVKSRHLTTYQGLLELEASLPDYVLQPRIKAPKPKTVTRAGFIKRKYRQHLQLVEMHEALLAAKLNQDVVAKKPLRYLEKIEKPIPRPPTPTVQVPLQEDEDRELATIYLQQIIRGRAIQNMMFEGKEKRIELIQELRSTHALQDAEQDMKKQEMASTVALQRQRRLHEHRESMVDEALSHVEGSSMGMMMDFLSKELIRLQEERRIHAFAMLAERRRRIREAEESGCRQVEERRRREEDEMFKQAVKVHQSSVDTFLEDVILGAVDRTADVQARKEIQEKAEAINDIAYEMESRRTKLESEEIVADLVHCFLLPEARKSTVREKIKRQQRKYLLAAHNEIRKDGEDIIDMNAVVLPKAASRQATEELIQVTTGAVPSNELAVPSGESVVRENDSGVPSDASTVPSNLSAVPSNTAAGQSYTSATPSNTSAIPSDETSEAIPSKESTDAVPTNEMSEAVPTNVTTEDVPTNEISEAVPTNEMSEVVPTNEMSEAVPTNDTSEAVPSNEPSAEEPTNATTLNSSQDELIEAPPRPESQRSETSVDLPEKPGTV